MTTQVSNVAWMASWLAVIVTLFSVTTIGIIMAANAGLVNDLQDLKLLVLANNVTFMEMYEQIIAANITALFLRVNLAYQQLIDLSETQTVLLSDLQIIYNNITSANVSVIDINNQIVNISSTLTVIETAIVTYETITGPELEANITALQYNYDNATAPLLFYVNSVGPVNNTVTLVGTNGITVYGAAPDVVVDACAIQGNIFALSSDIDSTMTQLFQEIVLSNTVLGTLNGQFPILGNLLLDSAGEGLAVTTGPASNEVRVTVTGNTKQIQSAVGPALTLTTTYPLALSYPLASHIGIYSLLTCLGPSPNIVPGPGVLFQTDPAPTLIIQSPFSPDGNSGSQGCLISYNFYLNIGVIILPAPAGAYLDLFLPTGAEGTFTPTVYEGCAFNLGGPNAPLAFSGATGVFVFTVTVEFKNLVILSKLGMSFTTPGIWELFYCFAAGGSGCGAGFGDISPIIRIPFMPQQIPPPGPTSSTEHTTVTYTYTFTKIWVTPPTNDYFGLGIRVVANSLFGTPGFDATIAPPAPPEWTTWVAVQKIQ
jgi:hypothetical protein